MKQRIIVSVFGLLIILLALFQVIASTPFRNANYLLCIPVAEDSGEILFRVPTGRYAVKLVKIEDGMSSNLMTVPDFGGGKIAVELNGVINSTNINNGVASFGVLRETSRLCKIMWSDIDRGKFIEKGEKIFLMVRPSW